MGPGVGKRAGGPSRAQGTLDEWDLRVSHWVGVTLGSRVPHWAVMLFEHGGNGLLWFPGECRPQPRHVISRLHLACL